MSNKAQRIITVKHRYGWTMAGTLVCIARHMKKTDLDAEFSVVKDGRVHKIGSAKKPSVLKLLRVEAKEGDQLEVFAEGADAEEALEVFEVTAHRCALEMAEVVRLAQQGKP